MAIRLFLAWMHVVALSVGVAGVWSRARALRDAVNEPQNPTAIRRVYVGLAWWGAAVGVWVVSGLWLLFGSTERSTSSYFAEPAFLLKAALVVALVGLEVWPMKTLLRWRIRKTTPDARDVGRIEIIGYVQCVLVLAIVLASVAMSHHYASPVSAASSSQIAAADSVFPAPEPSGLETVTDADVALLERELSVPLDGVNLATLHSSFADRRGGGTRQHNALDLMAPRGTPVKSAVKGRVLKLFSSVAGGLMIYTADSSERFICLYAHLDKYAPGLRDGVPLERGQVIGFVGSTGNASANAPHLHFAIARSADVKNWSKGRPIDPLPVLRAAGSVGR